MLPEPGLPHGKTKPRLLGCFLHSSFLPTAPRSAPTPPNTSTHPRSPCAQHLPIAARSRGAPGCWRGWRRPGSSPPALITHKNL